MQDQPWTRAPLVAVDLEGTGAQDKEHEAILEVALVPLHGGSPDMAGAWQTLVNPGRPVPKRPWISPGLTDEVLADAPSPEQVGRELAPRVVGVCLVGHNVRVDWKLVHRHYPELRPTGLVDTLKLARNTGVAAPRGLGALLDRFDLRGLVEELVPDGRSHRALWDTVGAAVSAEEPPKCARNQGASERNRASNKLNLEI
mgnify:CR=1 FL=1